VANLLGLPLDLRAPPGISTKPENRTGNGCSLPHLLGIFKAAEVFFPWCFDSWNDLWISFLSNLLDVSQIAFPL
jgi:hypothetical protein